MACFRETRWQLAAALGIALALHLILAAVLAWTGLSHRDAATMPPETAAALEPDSHREEIAPTPPIGQGELRRRIDASLSAFSGEPAQQLAQRADDAADWLETHSTGEAMDDIGNVVCEAYAARTRAFAPVDPRPPGEFDYNTMLPYAVRQTVAEDGTSRVIYTWVDEEGRSMNVDVPLEASDPALTRALTLAERSALMRQLFQTSILPVLDSRLQPQPLSASQSPSPTHP